MFWYAISQTKSVLVIEHQRVCSYSYLYHLHEYKLCRCSRTRILPPSRPGTKPLVMLLCSFFWGTKTNQYQLVKSFVRLPRPSMYVGTYRNSTINAPAAVPLGLFYSQCSLSWDEIIRQVGINVECQLLFYQPLHASRAE